MCLERSDHDPVSSRGGSDDAAESKKLRRSPDGLARWPWADKVGRSEVDCGQSLSGREVENDQARDGDCVQCPGQKR